MNLDSLAAIQKLDTQNVSASIDSLPEQIGQTWDEVNQVEIPKEYSDAKNIVLAGMGGSALGGRISQYLFSDMIRGPLEVVTGYKLPHYANYDSLVILYSYSGNTEETIACAQQALKSNAKAFIVATGGELAEFAKKDNLPCYIFSPKFNPSNQPRMSLGYAVTVMLALLNMTGFVSIDEIQIKDLIVHTQNIVDQYNVRIQTSDNHAKSLAHRLAHKIPVLVSSEHLWGVAHAVKNQFNENAKTFTTNFDIPELNHHLLEGLQFPQLAHQILHFVLFESELYSERVQKRYPITAEVIEKNKYEISSYKLQASTKLEQAFEMLTFGSYTGFYLSMLNGIDPAPIPWVDYFKEKLS